MGLSALDGERTGRQPSARGVACCVVCSAPCGEIERVGTADAMAGDFPEPVKWGLLTFTCEAFKCGQDQPQRASM
jgi:hypothetical protein